MSGITEAWAIFFVFNLCTCRHRYVKIKLEARIKPSQPVSTCNVQILKFYIYILLALLMS